MEKVFGYPTFDADGEQILTTYENEYKAMNMDIRVYRMKKDSTREFCRAGEELAVLLLSGEIRYEWEEGSREVSRKDVFTEGPWCVHVCTGKSVRVKAISDCEILLQCTKNDTTFPSKIYAPKDAPYKYSCVGEFGNVAKRRVNTIFDHEIAPYSNMVLGEVLNDKGNWSGYLPHRHPQPETYYFKFDHPEGFGASFVGDEVFKSVDGSFSAIPGGKLHPQAVAPGYQMYTCWMIRHIDGNPWLQTDRCEDEKYIWLHDVKD
ncbi:5-deoxy-glucuronate isomerase [Blautia liquoris]|uniref:5-deoxy-glucuronate isomerase n=1 Tax=Blautia liquoris TaxID=2779518 RepID=A0A7M2RFN5_9FIRM|nr:5-deoxy-glucuronate isomerase [Blautia liquoris]QOV18377.1 5-deoxy-glucuronate isomerase [Blautia liquoris]